MNYIEVNLIPQPCSEDTCDVLAALLAPLGYDSFANETDAAGGVTSLKAYVTQNQWDSAALNDLLADLPLEGVEVTWVAREVEMQDWNEEWEAAQQFEPIVILPQADGTALCCVHSPAAPSDSVPACRYEVVIDPKMSFGSGTHETTSQLLEEIIGLHHTQPVGDVLDMGTGTGVLGILCGLMGDRVRAIEIDDWVAANAVDNVLLNGLAGQVAVECGDAALLTGVEDAYDLVLANINRNVLLADMVAYAHAMRRGATLLMSGFYTADIPSIRECAEALGLEFQGQRSRNEWAVVRIVKP